MPKYKFIIILFIYLLVACSKSPSNQNANIDTEPDSAKVRQNNESEINQKTATTAPEEEVATFEKLLRDLKSDDLTIRRKATWILGEVKFATVVEPLIRLLEDKHYKGRWEAALALGKVKNAQAVEPLIATLNDENARVREISAWALGELAESFANEPLVNALNDKDLWVRTEAANALEKLGWQPDGTKQVYFLIAKKQWDNLIELGELAVDPLIEFLADENKSIRQNAAKTLGKLGNKKAVNALRMAVQDEERDVRAESIFALFELGEVDIDLLIEILEDRYSLIRGQAAIALGKIGSPQAIEHLIKALGFDSDPPITQAKEALIKIGPQIIDQLILALTDENFHKRNRVAEILKSLGWKTKDMEKQAYYLIAREKWEDVIKLGEAAIKPLVQTLRCNDYSATLKAATTLDKLGWQPLGTEETVYYLIARQKTAEIVALGEPAFNYLIDNLQAGDNWTRKTLKKIGKPATPSLLAALKHENSKIRSWAINILKQIGDEQIVKPLSDLLKTDDWHGDTRREVIFLISQFGESNVVEPLLTCLNDKNPEVRTAAARALNLPKYRKYIIPQLDASVIDTNLPALKAKAKTLNRLGGQPQEIGKKVYYYIGLGHSRLITQLGSAAVMPLIKMLAVNTDWATAIIIGHLSDLGDQRATEPIIEVLRYGLHKTKTVTPGALGELGDSMAVAPLIEALHDENQNHVVAAIEALGEIGDSRAVIPLNKLLTKDKNEGSVLQVQIEKALQMIKDKRKSFPSARDI